MLGETIRPCGVVWCSLRPRPSKPSAIHLLPDREVLLVGARGDLGVEVLAGQRIGDEAAGLELVEVLPVRQQVHQIDFHEISGDFMGEEGEWPPACQTVSRTYTVRGAMESSPPPDGGWY